MKLDKPTVVQGGGPYLVRKQHIIRKPASRSGETHWYLQSNYAERSQYHYNKPLCHQNTTGTNIQIIVSRH